MFDLGDLWSLGIDTVNTVGVLAEPDNVALTITLPDGTEAAPTILNPRLGRYTSEYEPTLIGRHTARWLVTWDDGTPDAQLDILNVQPPDPGGLLSLAAAKNYLKIPLTQDSDDEELRDWIAALTEPVENMVGPCVIREYTTVVRTHGSSWWLPRPPVIELMSATPLTTGYGPMSLPELRLVGATGQVIRANGTCVPGGMWTVVYKAGREVIPANIIAGAKMILRHLWENQRGAGGGRNRMMTEEIQPAGFPWAIPKAAADLLAPHHHGPLVG